MTGRDTSKKPRWKYDWLFRFFLRLVSAILPLLAAMGIANLIYILKYAGLFGFAIALFFPAVLQLTSIYACNKEFKPSVPSEWTPLINQERQESVELKFRGVISKLGVLEFRKKSRKHYETPYSRGYLSHPMFVIAIICSGCCLFVMAVTSLGISPQKLKCTF